MDERLYLTSEAIPVPHGFCVRTGGVSQGDLASLNFGFSVGDDRQRVEENFRRLFAAAQLELEGLCTISQVHGSRVLKADPGRLRSWADPIGEADALWTDRSGTTIGIKTADCVPILIHDPDGGKVAAVHSGWRGTVAKVASGAVVALAREGARPERLSVAIGPSIRACCFVVSSDLADRFSAEFGDRVVRSAPNGQDRTVDLALAIAQSLAQAGVDPARIDVRPECTACDPATFFSHRRTQGKTGRHLSFIARP